jgi:hypothetical protein
MFADCCMLGPHGGHRTTATAIIDQGANLPFVGIITSCSSPFYFAATNNRHISFPHDVPSRTMRHNVQFGIEAAEPMAPMLAGMLFLTLSGMHCRLSGTLPYIFLHRTQLTTTPQRPSTRHDLNGQWQPPWCPTPSTARHKGYPACWLIVLCGGAGIEAPWQLWDNDNQQGWRGTV